MLKAPIAVDFRIPANVVLHSEGICGSLFLVHLAHHHCLSPEPHLRLALGDSSHAGQQDVYDMVSCTVLGN